MSDVLYQDPLQGEPFAQLPTPKSLDPIPKSISLTDPIMLRYTLCLSIVIRNCFHVYLCWRQFRLCKRSQEPPPQMLGIMSQATFDSSKDREMRTVELQLIRYIFDAILSCLELHCGVFPYLWKLTMLWYRRIGDDVWQNLVFMVIFSTYMVMRTIPSVLYDKLVLEPYYGADPEKVRTLVGLLCASAFLIVLVQVALIPITVIFLFIEGNGGWYFVLWIWGFLFVLSIVCLLFFSLFGAPCLGKSTKLPEGNLRKELTKVFSDFKFPSNRVYVVQTFHISNATAYVWGCCCCKRLIILDNLIYNRGKPIEELHEDEVGLGLKDEQLAAFLAHLLSHWRRYHLFKSFTMVHISLLIYLLLFGTCYRQQTLYEAAGFSYEFYPRIVGYWLVYKYVMPPYLTITNWIIFYFIRHFEYSADKYAWKLGYSQDLKSALLKLFADNRLFPMVDHWYLMWHRVRPSILQRLSNLHRLEVGSRATRLELI
ncbi:uncharacterized protein Dwil_GK24789 [Drosophila willistoni]|uniref:CAAX prenyl protease n=1 Tax=Drosophila willistoni TaxID=7260 RepID=B4N180_DROWI|nr:CAAX prenyl protease 1 homolog [Drosophila willistoni]EDW78020.1 uncharacterized protein Dwil_GK24789 [Drosophila willistoni]